MCGDSDRAHFDWTQAVGSETNMWTTNVAEGKGKGKGLDAYTSGGGGLAACPGRFPWPHTDKSVCGYVGGSILDDIAAPGKITGKFNVGDVIQTRLEKNFKTVHNFKF